MAYTPSQFDRFYREINGGEGEIAPPLLVGALRYRFGLHSLTFVALSSAVTACESNSFVLISPQRDLVVREVFACNTKLCLGEYGGEGEIRTHETREGPPGFKTGAFNHSATSPDDGFLLKEKRIS